MSKEKPIIFNTEMVRDILEGRKTQTRRTIKWQPYHDGEKVNFTFSGMSLGHYCTGVPDSGYVLYSQGRGGTWEQRTKPEHCPYGPGDVLWVRETWLEYKGYYFYKADGKHQKLDNLVGERPFFKWRPSTHMPKEATRIFLRVTGVRVERLHDITVEDIVAEGFPPLIISLGHEHYDHVHGSNWLGFNWYRELWDSIYAKDGFGWDANPWVWVIEFRRAENDQL